MASLTKELEDTLLSLSEREKLQLAATLLTSVPADITDPLEVIQEEWDSEISRRISEIDKGSVKGIPAEEVFDQLNKEFGWKR